MPASSDNTRHKEKKKLLTAGKKFCLPSLEKSAYRGGKIVLTIQWKISLPCNCKIILPPTDITAASKMKLGLKMDWLL
jgi:hypothetical protein